MVKSMLSRREALTLMGRAGIVAAGVGPMAALVAACQSGSTTPAGGSPGASASTGASGSTMDRWNKQGFVPLGYEEAAPYSFVDPNSGELTGLDVDISAAIFKTMGLPAFEPILTSSTARIPGLQAGRWDFIGNAFFILPQRCALVAFTNPLHVSIETALVAKGNPKNISKGRHHRRSQPEDRHQRRRQRPAAVFAGRRARQPGIGLPGRSDGCPVGR